MWYGEHGASPIEVEYAPPVLLTLVCTQFKLWGGAPRIVLKTFCGHNKRGGKSTHVWKSKTKHQLSVSNQEDRGHVRTNDNLAMPVVHVLRCTQLRWMDSIDLVSSKFCL